MALSFCSQCGGKIENGVCVQCGARYPEMAAQTGPVGVQPQYSGVQPQYSGVQPQYTNAQPQPSKNIPSNTGLVEPDEQVITTIGNGYAENFLTSGILGSTTAMLTNKRLYYRGKAIGMGSAFMTKTKQIIELSEITAVNMTRFDRIFLSVINFLADQIFIIMILLFSNTTTTAGSRGPNIAGMILAIELGLIVFYTLLGLLSVKTMMRVEYEGGFLLIPVKLFSFSACSNFMQQTLIARNELIKEEADDLDPCLL